MRYPILSLALVLGCVLIDTTPLLAECPLDHFIIGCNRDGVWGTQDDRCLFVNAWQKYRDSGDIPHGAWHYPLQRAASFIKDYPYRIGEPGFDAYQTFDPFASYTYDPNRALAGEPYLDYRIVVECIALSPGLRAVHKEIPQSTVDAIGEGFDHSEIYRMRNDPHMHMSYQADSGQALRWITWRVMDTLEDGDTYKPSDPFTIVFNTDPNDGDLVVNGVVDVYDLIQLTHHWLDSNGSPQNDYHERADANRDGVVNLVDFAMLASHWTAFYAKPIAN